MDEVDQEKTLFVTSQGLFCYKVVSFGLKNTSATYQRLMNKMFANQLRRSVQVYVDDMLVKSRREENHLKDLEETFSTLHSYNMKVNPSKCAFRVTTGKFLGLPFLPTTTKSFTTKGRVLPVFGGLPDSYKRGLGQRGKQGLKTRALRQPGISWCRGEVPTHGKASLCLSYSSPQTQTILPSTHGNRSNRKTLTTGHKQPRSRWSVSAMGDRIE